VYFNNDMFWGRMVSWFDYFRPISYARQLFHAYTTPEGKCFMDSFSDNNKAERDPSKNVGARKGTRRAIVFMESVHYFETLDDESTRTLTPIKRCTTTDTSMDAQQSPPSSLLLSPPASMHSKFTTRVTNDNSPAPSVTDFRPLRPSAFFKLTMPEH
jgi:hypothetical protein